MAKISIKKILYPPSLFLEMEGANGSYFFKDSSKNNYPYSIYGNPPPTLSTSVKKNGNSSLFFPGISTNMLGVNPNNNDLRLGTENFTLEFLCYFNSDVTPNNQKALLIANAYNIYDTGGVFIISITVDRKIQWFLKNTFTRTIDNILSINTWHEIALIRKDAELFLYINGIQMDSYTIGKNTSLNCTSNYTIALGSDGYGNLYKGYLDDIKITKNFIKYPQIPPTKLNIKKIIEGSQVSSLSGLSLWLKADAGVSLGGGNHVNTWVDQSPNGNNAIGPTSKKPVYVSNVLNGKPVIDFDTTQYFTSNNQNLNNNSSIFVVVKPRGNRGTLISTSNYQGINFYLGGNPYNSLAIGVTNLVGIANDYANNGNDWMIASTIRSNNLTSKIYKNGNQVAVGSYDSYYLNPTNQLIIGADADLNSYWNINAQMAEIIIYNRALTDEENLSVINYLNSKYNIYSSSYVQNGKLRIKTPPFPTNGLLAFWRLNNPDGLSTISSDFGSYTLQVGGFGYQSAVGKINNCFYFADSSKGLFTNQQILNQTTNPQNFSCAFWYKTPNSTNYVFTCGSAFGSLGFHFDYLGTQYQYSYGLGMEFSVATGNQNNGNSWGRLAVGSLFDADTWYHIVGTYDLSSQTMKLYVNGSLVGTLTGVISSGNEHPDWHGFGLNGSVRYNDKEYGGNQYLDAVGIWNKALTESEIAQLYDRGNGSEI